MGTILGPKPFAFILCNFEDSPTPEPFTRDQAEAALEVIYRFWTTMSNTMCSLTGTTLSDWITLPITNTDFQAQHTTRASMIQYAKDESGIDQTKYVGFIIIFSESVGNAWTSGNGAIFFPSLMRTSNICHEMTHILGMRTHSFDFSARINAPPWSAPGEYYDQTDIMSAQNCWHTPLDPADPFSGHGPHHCMMWKDQFGWLRGSRVRRIKWDELDEPFDTTVQVTQRQSPASDGVVAVFFRDMSIEYAFPHGFDEGLPRSGVLIHQRVNTQPWILVPDLANHEDQKFWSAGEVCSRVTTGDLPGDQFFIWIKETNEAKGYAVVNISNSPVAPCARVQIKAIRKGWSREKRREYISHVGVDDGNGGLSPVNRSTVVSWIETKRNTFFVVGADGRTAEVIAEEHWIRTASDGSTANNLYSLPLF